MTISILDCTLRDGGYINNWEFGHSHIKRVLAHLTEATIDFIECGYLDNKLPYNQELSIFDEVHRLKEVLPVNKKKSKYVCMINYGEYSLNDIPNYDGSYIDGIRVVFHKRQMKEALKFCLELKEKGYLLFVQPMVTNNYSDEEILYMAKQINDISPYAFYIVDSFGVMKKKDLLRLFYLIDNNIEEHIQIGYHSHNNLQLAYSNAQAFAEVKTNRARIIDASVFGMGRGAGNLNTELFVQFLNEQYNTFYNVNPLLQIIDETVSSIYAEHYWGYSLPHYLSAIYKCHPNYATYLADKNTLGVKAIQEILSRIETSKKDFFSKRYIEELYIRFQKRMIEDSAVKKTLAKELKGRKLLLIAPGNSIELYKEHVYQFIKKYNPVCISVNFIPDNFICHYTFISNAKRLEQLEKSFHKSKLIITSNLETKDKNAIKVNYSDLLNMHDAVADNSTLMLFHLLQNIDIKEVFVAGFDGYENNYNQNYVDKELMISMSNKKIIELNTAIRIVLKEISSNLEIEFLTPSKYEFMLNEG